MQFISGFAAFLDYRYWFNTRPVPLGPSLVSGFLVFFAWFLVAAFVLYMVARYYRKVDRLKHGIFARFAHLLFNVGWIGLLMLFFTYEQAPILSMRLWFLMLTVYLLVRLSLLAKYVIREYPLQKATAAERERKRKYLSNKRK